MIKNVDFVSIPVADQKRALALGLYFQTLMPGRMPRQRDDAHAVAEIVVAVD